MPDEPKVIEFKYDNEIALTVVLVGDISTMRHNKATGYKIIDGFLFVMNGDRVIASYNHDKWILIRE